MFIKDMKPKKRTQLRILFGKLYYTYKRYLQWYFGKNKYSKNKESILLPHIIIQHETPLIRNLKNVDMWLQYNKVTNLSLAIENIDGILIKPGEVFSYWKLVGKPTKRKGYKAGMVLFYGGFKPGIGGGLCQLSNLIYWMTLHTPLEVIERYRHSFDVFPDATRIQPFGSGATCVYNYRDLQIKNNTNEEYQLHIYLTEKTLQGEWRCSKKNNTKYEVYEKEHYITHEYWGGYVRHNKIYRKVYLAEGNDFIDEYITENHAIMMYQPYIETGILS